MDHGSHTCSHRGRPQCWYLSNICDGDGSQGLVQNAHALRRAFFDHRIRTIGVLHDIVKHPSVYNVSDFGLADSNRTPIVFI